MRFDEDMGEGSNQIRGFAEGEVRINDNIYQKSVIVTPDKIIEDWEPQCFNDITMEHLSKLVDLKPDVVLLGTGLKHIIAEPVLLQPFFENRIGIEVMSTDAACRTYNVIMAEGRYVVAALVLR